MSDIINNIINDKQDIKNQLGTSPSVILAAKFFGDNIILASSITKLEELNLSGAMLWGSPEFGVWGTAKWGGAEGKSFILDNNAFGYLNINVLGDGSVAYSVFSILPRNNIFNEYFTTKEYINKYSTGTIDLVHKTYTLSSSQKLLSNAIAKLRQPITSVKFIINSTENSSLKLEVSNDNGITWTEIQIGQKYIFGNSSNEDILKYRITNTGSADITISAPLICVINN